MGEPAHKKEPGLNVLSVGRTPYRLNGLELYFKTKIHCPKCGNLISIRELWEDDVLERARRTYDQCRRLLLEE